MQNNPVAVHLPSLSKSLEYEQIQGSLQIILRQVQYP